MTADQIKQLWSDNGSSVSGAGTEMHFNIECFMNNPTLSHPYTHADLLADYNNMFKKELKEKLAQSQTPEWKFFLKYIEDHPDMKPYRTEWTIYDEDIKLTGSIDMVYEKPDGTLAIYDWKRSKDITRVNNFNEYALTPCISHMPNSNFWHYSLQLNIYKQVLQRKYGKQVSELCLVRLHPDATEETYELISVPDLSKDVDELFKIKEEEQRSV
jgi:ATP-dependent exoDNAse (exonuclease V) beta subunit